MIRFRWAVCQLDQLQKCIDLDQLKKELRNLPRTLDATYQRMIHNIDPIHKEKAIFLLQLLLAFDRPLKLDEVVDAIAIDIQNKSFRMSDRMPHPRDVAVLCPSLVVLSDHGSPSMCGADNEVRFAHFSVKEYLQSGRVDTSIAEQLSDTPLRKTVITKCICYLLQLRFEASVHSFMHRMPWVEGAADFVFEHAHDFDSYLEVTTLVDQLLRDRACFADLRRISEPELTVSERCDTSWKRFPLPSPIFYAAIARIHSFIRTFIQLRGVDTQIGTYDDAVVGASSVGDTRMVQELLQHGADANTRSRYPLGALVSACVRGHSEVVQILLDYGANANEENEEFGKPLYVALEHGHTDVAQVLLKNGADINARSFHDDTALQAAAASISAGNLETMQWLIDNGAYINAQGGEYGSALQAAVHSGDIEVVELLLSSGADVNAQGGAYGGPLQAASYLEDIEVAELLLANGANVNAQGGKYGNALQIAVYGASIEAVELLLDNGVDVNAQGGEYGSALQAASNRGCLEVVQLLLDQGAQVNTQGGAYGNALQDASIAGHVKIIELLLDKGAQVNAQGGFYGNALQAASCNGHVEVVKLLLNNGADVNAQGGRYDNAFHAASKIYDYMSREAIETVLITHGALYKQRRPELQR